jgi:AcrR family transcriptional regulator
MVKHSQTSARRGRSPSESGRLAAGGGRRTASADGSPSKAGASPAKRGRSTVKPAAKSTVKSGPEVKSGPTAKPASGSVRSGRVGRPVRPQGAEGAREAILDQAVWVFSEKGLAGSTLKEISRRAGVTPAVAHYHFGNRETLVRETFERHVKPIVDYIWRTVVDVEGGPLDMLKEIHRRLAASLAQAPWFLPLWSREVASEGGRLRGYLYSILDREIFAKFAARIRQGQRDGQINPRLVPELVFVSLVSGLHFPALSMALWAAAGAGPPLAFETLLEHVWSLAEHGLTGGPSREDGGRDGGPSREDGGRDGGPSRDEANCSGDGVDPGRSGSGPTGKGTGDCGRRSMKGGHR